MWMEINRDALIHAAVIPQRRCDQITECRLIARGESWAGFSISESYPTLKLTFAVLSQF